MSSSFNSKLLWETEDALRDYLESTVSFASSPAVWISLGDFTRDIQSSQELILKVLLNKFVRFGILELPLNQKTWICPICQKPHELMIILNQTLQNCDCGQPLQSMTDYATPDEPCLLVAMMNDDFMFVITPKQKKHMIEHMIKRQYGNLQNPEVLMNKNYLQNQIESLKKINDALMKQFQSNETKREDYEQGLYRLQTLEDIVKTDREEEFFDWKTQEKKFDGYLLSHSHPNGNGLSYIEYQITSTYLLPDARLTVQLMRIHHWEGMAPCPYEGDFLVETQIEHWKDEQSIPHVLMLTQRYFMTLEEAKADMEVSKKNVLTASFDIIKQERVLLQWVKFNKEKE